MLEIKGLSVRYDANVAVDDVDFDVNRGEIVALMGANGAGKSSIMKAIAGLTPSGGRVVFEGQEFSSLSARDRVSHGIVHVLEQRGVFADLTVKENLDLGRYLRTKARSDEIARDLEFVFQLFPRLRERHGNKAGSLSGGEQQMLVIGRALMAAPKLLMLDEPSLGLAPVVVAEIVRVLRWLNAERGLSLLVSEQNAVLGLSLAHRAYVVQRGRIAAHGSDLERPDDVVQFYLGRAATGRPRNCASP